MAGRSKYQVTEDLNQPEIVNALMKIGCKVLSLSRVGGGVTDLLVINPRINRWILMEIKSKTGALNPKQKSFHREWKGFTCVVRTVEQAIEVMTRV